MRIHYRDDFTLTCRLTDAEGITIESFPACDFTGEVSAGAGTPFRFGRKDGRCTHCAVDADTLTVILDNHRLLPGTVSVKITFAFPDNIYPDGIRSNVAMTGGNLTADAIELVEGPGDNAPIPSIEVQLPIIVRSAYDLAVAAGYTGTKDEYAALLFALPEAVSSVQQMSTLTSDWAAGKRMVVDALNDRGVPTDPDASFASIADNLRSLPLPVEGEEPYCAPSEGMLDTNLRQLMARHRRVEYLSMHAVMCFSPSDVTQTFTAADAYLTSEGEFVADHEGAGVELTIPGGKMTWIIYYHRSRSFSLSIPRSPIVSVDLRMLNADEVTLSDNLAQLKQYSQVWDCERLVVAVSPANTSQLSYSGSLRELMLQAYLFSEVRSLQSVDFQSLRIVNGPNSEPTLLRVFVGDTVSFPALEVVNGGRLIWGPDIKKLNLPRLVEVGTGGNNATLLESCNRLSSIELPALEVSGATRLIYSCNSLTSVSLPRLCRIVSGELVSYCPALTSLELPSLTNMSGGGVVNNCSALTSLELPSLTNMSGGEIFSGGRISNDTIVYLPALTGTVYVVGWYCTVNAHLTVALGRQQDADICIRTQHSASDIWAITVLPGFRSSLSVRDGNYFATSMTPSSLSALIANLGDNTGHPTLTLTLGATNIAKLSADDIALAQAKNYTIE